MARAVVCLLGTVCIFPTGVDPDLWGHVRFGLDFLDRGALTTADPYSFTQDIPWLNHEWLSEAIMAMAYRGGGPLGLVVLKSLVIGAALVIAWRLFARGPEPLVAVTCFLVTVSAAMPISVTVRPHMFSFLGVAILCRLLIAPNRIGLAVVPALVAIWANMHGGWIVGAAILAAWAIFPPAEERFAAGHAVRLALVAASILATIMNPYGVRLWEFLAGTVRLTRDITEWQPLWKAAFVVIVPWVTTVVVALASLRASRRPPLAHLVIAAGLAYGSLRVMRLTPFFVVSTLMFVAPTLHQELAAARHRVRKSQAPALAFAALLAATFAIIGLSGVTFLTVRAAVRESCVLPAVDPTTAPDEAAASSLSGLPPGRLAVWFDWGEFAIWRFGPGLRVSMDGRRETVYSQRVIEEQAQVARGEREGVAFLERARPEYLWYPSSKAQLKAWLGTNGYRFDVETPQSFIAVRDDLPRLNFVRESASACFPSLVPTPLRRVSREGLSAQ